MRNCAYASDDHNHRRALREAKKISGKSGHSEAIVSSLEDYAALRKRLALLEDLFDHKTPHSSKVIKAGRRKRQWFS